MKKIILYLLLTTSSCWSGNEQEYPLDIVVERVQNTCPKPGPLQVKYDESKQTLQVEWIEKTNPLHYMISLDDQPYEVVKFTNNIGNKFLGNRHLFTEIPKGVHSICVRSVCLEEEPKLGIPVPVSSEEVCINLELSLEHSVAANHFGVPL